MGGEALIFKENYFPDNFGVVMKRLPYTFRDS